MSFPTLVLVHGSWHSPEHFGPLIKDLYSHGYKCVPVSLLSTQSPDSPPATLTDDTAAIRTAVTTELDDEQNNVVVIAHSFGAVPTNNALSGLSTPSRSATAASTSVTALVFLAGIALPSGVSFLKAIGGRYGPMQDLRTPDFLWVGQPGPVHYFYNDLPSEEAEHWASLLKQQSARAYEEDVTYAAYVDIPCAYLYCTLDNAMALQIQQGMVGAAKAAGARIEVEETVESGHSPYLSRVAETSKFVRRVAEAYNR